jgi:hypothetical protein
VTTTAVFSGRWRFEVEEWLCLRNRRILPERELLRPWISRMSMFEVKASECLGHVMARFFVPSRSVGRCDFGIATIGR